MKEFMYIFRGAIANEQAFAKLSPEAMQKEMQKRDGRWHGRRIGPAAVLGDWSARLGDSEKAKTYFEEAIHLTHSPAEKQFLKTKIDRLP